MFRIIFVCLISLQLSAQEWQLSYSGAPGDVQEKWLSGLPGSLWKIDFAAYTITDTLEFITYNGSVKFAAGRNLPQNHWGYREYYYSEQARDTIVTSVPANYPYTFWENAGMIRVYYEIPQKNCGFTLRCIGNSVEMTHYELRVENITPGMIIPDTVFVKTCLPKNTIEYITNNDHCTIKILIKLGYGFEDPIYHHPSCIDSKDGWLEFDSTSGVQNIYDLGVGYHRIHVENKNCEKNLEFELIPTKLCQNEFYLPNIFSPNDDGINDDFFICHPLDIEYKIQIWNRWGGMVYDGNGITNRNGWDGDRAENGVYVYRIILLDKTLVGNVTLIR